MGSTRGGIIAAGEGSRFQNQGIRIPKPMISVAGKPLLGWTLAAFVRAGIDEITIIFNESVAPPCQKYIKDHFPRLHTELIVKNTSSSFESFREVSSRIETGPFLITTVDSIFHPDSIRDLVQKGPAYPGAEMVLGVTSFIDDEKPLFVELHKGGRILSLGKRKTDYVTCGAYWISSGASLDIRGEYTALRHFLADRVEKGAGLYGHDMGKTVDVDRPRDLAMAERFVAEFGRDPWE